MSGQRIEDCFQAPQDLQSNFFSALSARLAAAFSQRNAEPLHEVENSLQEAVKKVLKIAPAELRAAIKSSDSGGLILSAVALGKLSFAQELAAFVASRRADNEFFEELMKDGHQMLLKELLKGDRTNKELSKVLKQDEATISRKLRKLRESGITECRKNGVHVFNFLTPAASDFLQERSEGEDRGVNYELGDSAEIVSDFLSKKVSEVDPLFRSVPSFSSTQSLHDYA